MKEYILLKALKTIREEKNFLTNEEEYRLMSVLANKEK